MTFESVSRWFARRWTRAFITLCILSQLIGYLGLAYLVHSDTGLSPWHWKANLQNYFFALMPVYSVFAITVMIRIDPVLRLASALRPEDRDR